MTLLRGKTNLHQVRGSQSPQPVMICSLVYLLDELVKAAQSSPEDAQHIVEHLLKKLESKNPVIKAKVGVKAENMIAAW